MTSRWSWLALGVGGYVAFTLAAFPARVALRWFAPPELTLAGVQGTAWSGAAAGGSVGGFAVRDLRWQLSPWPLLIGRVSGRVEARLADGFLSTDLTASGQRVSLSNLRGGTSIAALGGVLPVGGIRGQASATLSELEIELGWPSRVIGELRLAGVEVPPFMSSGGPQLLPLGDYTITFSAAPAGELLAKFVDNGGPLEVSGTLELDAARNYTLDALITPRDSAPEELVAGLKIMTTDPDPEGRRRLTLTGSL